MKPTRTPVLAAAALALLAVVVLVWPSGLGGATTYVVTRGASMTPTYSRGDLAIVRRSDSYRVGDVAAYRSTTAHRVVVHRIVAIDGDTFTFKGDANSFRDPEQVRRSAVVGGVALHLPMVGSVLLWLSHPFNALLLLALAGLLWWDRQRLRGLLDRRETPQPQPVAEKGGWDADLDRSRVVSIADLSFPHELAVAEVVDPGDLTRLAERYDRPVLHDAASGVLFVVEAAMLYRCALPADAAGGPATLSIVREVAPAPAPVVEVEPYDDAEPYEQLAAADEGALAEELAAYDDASMPLTPAPAPLPASAASATAPQPRARARKWYDRSPADRRHTPQGRDWGYASSVPVHAPAHWTTG